MRSKVQRIALGLPSTRPAARLVRLLYDGHLCACFGKRIRRDESGNTCADNREVVHIYLRIRARRIHLLETKPPCPAAPPRVEIRGQAARQCVTALARQI